MDYFDLSTLISFDKDTLKGLIVIGIVVVIAMIYLATQTSSSPPQQSAKMMAINTSVPDQIFMKTDPDGNISTHDFATTPLNSNFSVAGNVNASGLNVAGVITATNSTPLVLGSGGTGATFNNWTLHTPGRRELVFAPRKADNSDWQWENSITFKDGAICIGDVCITKEELRNIKAGNFNNLTTKLLTVDKSTEDWGSAIILKAGKRENAYLDFLNKDGARNTFIVGNPDGLYVDKRVTSGVINTPKFEGVGERITNLTEAVRGGGYHLKNANIQNAGNHILSNI